MADKSRKDLKGEQHKETRKQLLTDASEIYQAESAAGARERLCTFAQKWREQAPKAVATLQRGAQVAFYSQAQRLNAGWSKPKTTSWETSRSLFFDWLNLHSWPGIHYQRTSDT